MSALIIDPSYVFISKVDWGDENLRDDFFEALFDLMNSIRHSSNPVIYWSERLDLKLYQYPYETPYMLDANWRNRLVAILGKDFSRFTEYVDEYFSSDIEIVPKVAISYKEEAEVEEAFGGIIGRCAIKSKPFYTKLKHNNSVREIEIQLNGSTIQKSKIITTTLDWLEYCNAYSEFWPSAPDSTIFKRLIEVATGVPEEAENFPIYLTERFNRSIMDVTDYGERCKISQQIIKRLGMSRQAASADPGLRDHPVKGLKESEKVRRFYIDGVCRVHYEYEGSKIVLLKYYSAGEHDDGLN